MYIIYLYVCIQTLICFVKTLHLHCKEGREIKDVGSIFILRKEKFLVLKRLSGFMSPLH